MIEPIIGLDVNFQTVKYLKFISLQWNRKYYDVGDFELYVKAEEWDSTIKYIKRPDRRELGIVNKPEYSQNINGNFYIVFGTFAEILLDEKVIYPLYYSAGAINVTTQSRTLVTTYKDNSLIILDSSQPTLGTSITKQETDGGGLGKTIRAMLKPQELAYKLVHNGTNYIFTVWQGLDRTQSQSTNEPVVLSAGFKNICKMRYSVDDSNYKNYAYVRGVEKFTDPDVFESDNIQIADVRAVGETEKKVIYLDSNRSITDPGMSQITNFEQGLIQYGIEELQNYKRIINLEFDVISSKLNYPTEFDLGDKCDIVVDEFGVSYEARVIEIYEVYEENKEEITVVMGDKIPTQYEKARLK